MQKLVFTSICFILFVGMLHSQYSISGTVTNGSGEPLYQASVFLVETQYATITDENGYFILSDLEAGEHTLKTSYVGYEGYVEYISLDSDQSLEINLGENNLYLNMVNVSTNRVEKDGVFAVTEVSKEELAEDNLGQDVPFLLRWTPSAVVTSDAGTGIGYTGLRIRGSDATRINVTINGVPLNDGESQGVFWVDLPDFATSVDNIQIQRGVGTSTNGPGAFGGTVSLMTDKIYQNNYIHLNSTYGSFNTRKFNVALGTGLINNKYSIDGRYSVIKSDGYIDRGSADLSSYYFALNRVTDKSSLKFIMFSGSEVTYQAWYGVPEAKALGDEEGARAHFDWNQSWLYPTKADSLNYFNSDRKYNYYQYENQVDDYTQSHYQLHHAVSPSDKFIFKTTLHYTKGKGFFEQFRYQDDYSFYGLPPTNVQGDSIATGDTLVRRKWLDNDFYGGIVTAKYLLNDGSIQVGGAMSRYDGDHFGRVVQAQGFVTSNLLRSSRRYYENNGTKDDYNVYIKYDQKIASKWNVFADLQYRGVEYVVEGLNDDKNEINDSRSFSFFNPKFGVSYQHSEKHNFYGSLAMANREPDRNDIIAITDTKAKAEQLTDIEFGYRYSSSKLKLEVNNYYMKYKDQLVVTGALDDVGNSLRLNVDDSYRMGTEISATTSLSKNLFWNINTTLSQNKISEFIEEVDPITIEHENTDIAFSPSVVIGNSFLYDLGKDLQLELSTKYVGKQYLDNTSNEDRKLDPYTYTNLRVGYDLDLPNVDGLKLSLQVNNLFNTKYSANGYTYSYAISDTDVYTENYLYPQAGIHFMLGAQLRL